MKIVLANKFYYRRGGDCIYTMNVEKMLREKGHEVAVFAMQYPENEESEWSQGQRDRYIDSLSLIVNNATTSPNYISHQCLQRHTAWREQATWSPRTFTSQRRSIFHRPKG